MRVLNALGCLRGFQSLDEASIHSICTFLPSAQLQNASKIASNGDAMAFARRHFANQHPQTAELSWHPIILGIRPRGYDGHDQAGYGIEGDLLLLTWEIMGLDIPWNIPPHIQ